VTSDQKSQLVNDYRYLILVHGSVLNPIQRRFGKGGRDQWEESDVKKHLMAVFNVPEENVYLPDWGGRNQSDSRHTGGTIIANYLHDILKKNPFAEILLVGYSHGGNAANIGLNILAQRNASGDDGFNLDQITLLNTATPAMYDYRLLTSTQALINAHLNFYNHRDFVQQTGALIGSSSRRMNVDGHEVGRAHHGAINQSVTLDVPSGLKDPFGVLAHGRMRSSPKIWKTYKIPQIRAAKDW